MKLHEVFQNSPFFVSMATAAAFDQPVPIVIQIIPMRFHEILFTSYDYRIAFVFQHLIGYHGNCGHFENFNT